MSSDDEEQLLKELSQELDSFEMSPHVSDDELSVAGGGHIAISVGACAPKQSQASIKSPSPPEKRHAPELTKRITYDPSVQCGIVPPGMPCRTRGENMSLSPPTSSGQMSPTSVCTATGYGYGHAGASVSLISLIDCTMLSWHRALADACHVEAYPCWC